MWEKYIICEKQLKTRTGIIGWIRDAITTTILFMHSEIMASQVEELVKECNRKTCEYKYKLAYWSFSNNFKEIQSDISFNGFKKEDYCKFLKICDNRLERARTFLNDIAVVLGFDFIALSIVATIAEEHETIWSLIINPDDHILTFLIVFLFASLIFLFVLMFHYRSQVHAWAAFKELALIKCS